MIYYIKGALEEVFDNSVVVDAGGIGYELIVSPATLGKLTKRGGAVKMYTYMHVKEDGVALYGFLSAEELKMFHRLITVSGIGPKVAQAMLSSLTPADIMLAIVTDDVQALSKAPGVGRKTAQRLVLELKDKIDTESVAGGEYLQAQQAIGSGAPSARQDAVDALIALGYGRGEVVRAVMETALDGMSAQQIIKQTLKRLSS